MEVSKSSFVFFKVLENDLQIEVPYHIKNILNANGYNSAIIFKLFKAENIERLEKFVRLKLPKILVPSNVSIENTESIQPFFFGECSDPTEFEFTKNERELLLKIARHVKIVVDSIENNSGLDHFQNEDGLEEALRYFTGAFYKPVMVPAIASEPQISYTHMFLNKLKNTADRNVNRVPAGYRFDDDIKDFAIYIRLLAGRMAYQTIHRNLELSLPSLSSIDRNIRKTDNELIEGELRCRQLLQYLEERRLPLIVLLSEDATRISGRPQFDIKTNQIVGFVLPTNDDGMPIPFSFSARNADEMIDHFSRQETAHFVNVVMAQPLANVPAFCLLLFSANSKFTAESAIKRWNFLSAELDKFGIVVMVIATDSDPRYNSAMRKSSGLGISHSPFRQQPIWFQCGTSNGCQSYPFYIQDTVHLATKLRNCFLKTKVNPKKLPFGEHCYIQVQHLEKILSSFTKDKHQLTASTLDPTDRQNFASVQRICDKKVTCLLKTSVKNSDATRKFLEIIAAIIEALSDRNISPLDRIERLWHSLFIIRIWRRFIISRKNASLRENFLSQNCYTCIELNAHSMVLLVLRLRERNNMSKYFLPFLLDSQPCEGFFRQIRSFTSTYSTIANCSVKEIVGRINKIQLQRDISFRSDLRFPRANNTKFKNETMYELPSENQIIERIEKSRVDACKFALDIGLVEERYIKDFNFSCQIQPITVKKIEPNHGSPKLKATLIGTYNPKMLAFNNFHSKFGKDRVPENSAFVEIKCQQMKRLVIKKTSFCWLLRSDYIKLSSDRLQRVRALTQPPNTRITRQKKSAFVGVKIKKIEQKLKLKKFL